MNAREAGWPCYTDEEIDAVSAVLRSNRVNYWTGTECREFEREFATWAGTAHAVALANGTVALDLALKALDISHGDEVVVTPRTFIASVSSVVNAGAIPVFADVEPESGNISARTIGPLIGERTRAIIPVHLGGWPCEMEAIMQLANRHGLRVIEDCAQAHGARIGDRSVGSFGDVGAWSFCQDKIMTTGGEGGMVTTDDGKLWSAMWSYKDHGKSWEAVYSQNHPPGFRWVHETFGTNWRMLELQAAIGRTQLRRMADWTRRRTAIARAIADTLANHAHFVRTPWPRDGLTHAFYRYYAYVRPEALPRGWDRDRIVAECRARGVGVLQGSCSEVYLEKAFDGTGWRPPHRLSTARSLGETSLMFLIHPTIDDDQLARECEQITEVFRLIAQ